jgi:Fe-S-cluster containining protein
MANREAERFYGSGLQFECLRCGRCCTGAPGYVYLSEQDIASIADFLKKDKISFLGEYTRSVTLFGEHRISLTERTNYDCVFWKGGDCLIYDARPYQCRAYPFWKGHLVSVREWEKAAERCPGINRGPVHTAEEIEHIVDGTPRYNSDRFTSLRGYPAPPGTGT